MTGRAPARITLGEFRDVVDIYSDASDPTDEQQSFTGTPFVSNLPAKIEHVGGHDKEQTTFVKYEVTCHYLEDVDTTMRITVTDGPFADENLNIGEVEVVRVRGRPRYLILHCIAVD